MKIAAIALASALAALHTDRQRARDLGAAGRARVRERFDVARNAATLAALMGAAAP